MSSYERLHTRRQLVLRDLFHIRDVVFLTFERNKLSQFEGRVVAVHDRHLFSLYEIPDGEPRLRPVVVRFDDLSETLHLHTPVHAPYTLAGVSAESIACYNFSMATGPSSLRFFLIPTLASAAILAGVGVLFGPVALFTAVLLVILEVTLSFDNAVVNAKVLEQMSPKWQQRFLTWGIVIAVFLTRAVLPILIVAASVALSPLTVATIAAFDPQKYAELLHGAEHIIASFGGIFLTMVGLKYFFDQGKDVHWIHVIEKRLAKWGSVEAIEIAIALIVLSAIALLVPAFSTSILFAGIIAITLFIIVQGAASSFAVSTERVAGAGIALFVYLNVLDAAFSLDSVVGAFALSTQLPIIIVGLGIGAYFVRALTVYMVRHGTLGNIIYIEHGAHWAILGLAAAMIANIFVNVPEPITGLIGLLFVGGAYLSSIRTVRQG